MYQFSDPNSTGISEVKKHALQNELAMLEADLQAMIRERDDSDIQERKKKKEIERVTIELQEIKKSNIKLADEITQTENRIRQLKKEIELMSMRKAT